MKIKPSKNYCLLDEEFSSENYTVTQYTQDGEWKEIQTGDYQVITAVDSSTVGRKILEVSYNGMTAQATVWVYTSNKFLPPIYHQGDEWETDYSDYSYAYLGIYPQTEIRDEKLTKDIVEAEYVNGDAWVDGVKYRRVATADSAVSDYEYFENDFGTAKYHYYQWEPIRWRVLENSIDSLRLVSDKILDAQIYTEDPNVWVSWKDSYLRQWMNQNFYNTAFTKAEQGILKEMTEDNVTDKVVTPSYQEVKNKDYGYSSIDKESKTRTYEPTGYSDIYGYFYGSEHQDSYEEGGWTWLRHMSEDGMYIDYFGENNIIRPTPVMDGEDSIGGTIMQIMVDPNSNLLATEDSGTSGPRTLTSLSVRKEKTSYIQGEQASTDDVEVSAVFEDGTKEKLKSQYQVGIIDTSKVGTQNLTISYTENGITKMATIPITVKSNVPVVKNYPVTKISIQGISKKIAANKSITLMADVSPSNATNKGVTWTTSNKKYATVTSKGKVTTKKAGAGKKVTITAKANDGSGVKATYTISIMKSAVKKITLKASKKTIKAGKSITLRTTIKTTGKKKNTNRTLKWTSSNKKYATVSSKGKVKVKKAGKGKRVTITVKSTDGTNKTAKIKLKIK